MKRSRASSNRDEKLFSLSPKTVVISVVICLGLLLVFGRDIKRALADRFRPNISFQNGSLQRGKGNERANREIQATVFDGEVYRTEERLREASAVAIAASIAGVAAFTERRPMRDVNDLINSIAERKLLPPGLELSKEGNILLSQYSTIHIRFRPSPFAVEVVSLGRTRLDGSALILRLPDEKQNGKTESRYFYSLTLENIKIPPAFASPTKILSYGWKSEIFSPTLPDGVNAEQLSTWVGGVKR